jgi:hypothetical protein
MATAESDKWDALRKTHWETNSERYWRDGELTLKLHLGQAAIEFAYRQAAGKLFVGDCSRQIGKSHWLAKKSVEVALQKPGSKGRVGTAFLTDLEQFIMPAFDFILDDCPRDVMPQFKAQKSEYVFPNGSKIRLVGRDRKPNGLRGNRLDFVGLDEAGFVSRLNYLYRSVLIPATTHVPDARLVMTSTQPETPDHEFVQFCDKAAIAGGYVKLDVYQNPLLSKSQIDELAAECGGYDSTAFRREYLCERVVEEGRAILADFNPTFHVKQSPQSIAHKYWLRLESLDSGVRDMTAGLFAYYDFDRATLCIEDEFAIQGHKVTTKNIAAICRDKEATHRYGTDYPVHLRIADNDNLILIQDLGTEYGLHFAPTSKDSLHAMVNKVKIWFQNNRIEIHPRCVRLISACQAGIWDKHRKEFARSDIHGHYDLISALVYMVRNVPETINPVPAFFIQDLSNVFARPPAESGSAAALRKVFGGK